MEKIIEQNQRVIDYYRKTAEDYDKEYDVPFYKLLYDKITCRYIEPYLPKEGVVLDPGGGTGKWAMPIANRGLQVVIFDISEEMLNVALRKVKEMGLEDYVRVKQGDICNIDFPDNHFDFVLAEGGPPFIMRTSRLPKVSFIISLPLNLYYHLQLSCSTNPYLQNESYKRRFATTGIIVWMEYGLKTLVRRLSTTNKA